MNERWAPAVGWPHYEISDLGRIRKLSGEPVGQWIASQGYVRARLSGPRALVRVHRLVAEAFVPNPERKPTVNHIDANRANNCAANLEWCTQAENIRHAWTLGRMRNGQKGRRSRSATLTDAEVAGIRSDAGTMSLQRIASKWGSNKRSVERIIKGKSYMTPPETTT